MNGIQIHNQIRKQAAELIAFTGAIYSLSGRDCNFKFDSVESAINGCLTNEPPVKAFETWCSTTSNPVIPVLFREYLRVKAELSDMLLFDFAEVRP